MKRKQKKKHLENMYSQEIVKTSPKKLKVTYAVQCEHKEITTTQGITNLLCKDTSQSGSPLKTINSACEEKGASSVSEYFSCVSSLPMPSCAEFSDMTKESLEPGPSGLFQDNRQMAEKDSNSEYHSCPSSAGNLIHTEFSDMTKESSEPGPSGLFQDNRQMAEKDSNSEYHSCPSSEDNPIHTESSNFQEDVSQPGPVMVSSWTQTARENYSDSEYSSSASKITLDEEEEFYQLQHGGLSLGSSEMPQPQDSEREDTSSPLPYVTVPFHPICKACMPSIHVTKEEKLMNIYYQRVQMKRGVAVLWDNSEKGVGPPLKKTKMEEMTCPEEIHTGVTHFYAPTRELLTESESNLEIEAQEESEESDEAEIPALEESSRAKTPDWLVALDSGFRCMGCCRVFPSLDVLQEHVQHGVNEGFSCQAFHLALALLKKNSKIEGKKKREKRKLKKRTPGSSQEGSLGTRTSSCKEIIFQSLKGKK